MAGGPPRCAVVSSAGSTCGARAVGTIGIGSAAEAAVTQLWTPTPFAFIGFNGADLFSVILQEIDQNSSNIGWKINEVCLCGCCSQLWYKI